MTLDPQLAEILEITKRIGRPPLEALPVEEARREYKKRADTFGLPPAEMFAVVERSVAGPAGEIPVRLYVPVGCPDPSPLLVFFHGGGWTVGDRDTHDRACRYLAEKVRCRIASVDYRLAPEHPFPAAVEDCGRPTPRSPATWRRGTLIPSASRSAATAPAAISRRSWRCSRGRSAPRRRACSC